ncbi:MAG: hypothetical protein BMS9Abin11_1636 [Gammaproteobacteria bacterium]|nr:MAG: hypothetical protein BMS9Abin11_1636 [Gammaproteobacteria bacterium]
MSNMLAYKRKQHLFSCFQKIHFILFTFRNDLASHLERSLSNHSYGYAFSSDRPTCFASLPRNANPS